VLTTMGVKALIVAGSLTGILIPQTARAAESAVRPQDPPRPLAECLAQSDGSADSFLACLRQKAEELGLPQTWIDRAQTFLENHPDWRERIQGVVERREARRDRRQAIRDRLEEMRQRRQERRDRFQQLWTSTPTPGV
jgi:hypothetical protein